MEAVEVLETALVSHALCIVPRAVGIASGEVAFLKVAVGFEAPDVAVILAGGVALGGGVGIECVEESVGIVPGSHFGACVGNVEVGVHVGVAEGVVPADGEFPASRAERTCIGVRSAGAENRRQHFAGSEHVLGFALIPVEAHVERVVEEAEVDTDVGGDDAFPCESGRYESGHAGLADFHTVL